MTHDRPHHETAPSGRRYCRCTCADCWDLDRGQGFATVCACPDCECIGSNHREMEGAP